MDSDVSGESRDGRNYSRVLFSPRSLNRSLNSVRPPLASSSQRACKQPESCRWVARAGCPSARIPHNAYPMEHSPLPSIGPQARGNPDVLVSLGSLGWPRHHVAGCAPMPAQGCCADKDERSHRLALCREQPSSLATHLRRTGRTRPEQGNCPISRLAMWHHELRLSRGSRLPELGSIGGSSRGLLRNPDLDACFLKFAMTASLPFPDHTSPTYLSYLALLASLQA